MLPQIIRGPLRIACAAVLLCAVSEAQASGDHPPGRMNQPESAEVLDEKTADVTGTIQSIALPSRVKLQYVEQGDPSGVPVLLLHGYTDSWRSFELVLPFLPMSIHAYALSQRGHGDSERPVSGYHPYDFAADVAAFMDARKIARAVIVGHSMGSYVAQCFAMEYPDRTLGVVLAASFTTLQGDAGIQEFWNTAVSKLADPIDPSFALEFQKSTLAVPVPQNFLDTVVQESLKVPAHVWKAALKGLMESDLSRGLGKIKAPTLIVWGDKDTYFLRDHQDALAAGIAGSQLVIYHGVGHGIHWEDPRRFAADLVAFAERLAK
ncbi:MAG: alpha/beta fold hydrolase [bacterium]